MALPCCSLVNISCQYSFMCECQLHPQKHCALPLMRSGHCPTPRSQNGRSERWELWNCSGFYELSLCWSVCRWLMFQPHMQLSPCYFRLKQPRPSCGDQRFGGPGECWKQFGHRDYRCLEGDLVFLGAFANLRNQQC